MTHGFRRRSFVDRYGSVRDQRDVRRPDCHCSQQSSGAPDGHGASAVLADRFKLRVHQETKPLPVFDLVRSRADGRLGPRLVKSDGSCLPLPSTSAPISDFTPYCGVKRSVPGAMSAEGFLSRFALLISFLPDVQRIVRDRTGLTEAFDIDLDFARDAADAQDKPPIMTALKEQLGVELRPATGPVDVIVIDHVEPPTPD